MAANFNNLLLRRKIMKRVFIIFTLLLTVLSGIFAEENVKGLNLIPVPAKLRNSMPAAIISGADNGFELPSSLDIGSNVLIPRSQGGIGSCSSWAVSSELTRIERIRNNWPVGKNISYFSPLFLYNQVNGGQDRGSSIYGNLNILVNQGCATWALFPYVEDYRIQPSVSARREAARYKIAEFKNLPVDLDSMRLALTKGYGLIVSFHVYDNFDGYAGGIYKPRGPSGVERRGERFSYHGMLILGYDDVRRNFMVLNSWGTSWGDKGYLYFSYDDLNTLISDCYIIIPKASLPTEALPPSRVQAGKGSNKNKVVTTWENNGADEYEIFRLCENELYISLGKTTKNNFEDTTAIPNQHYFYFVASHKGEYLSELSFAAEGWANDKAVELPGIPLGFTVNRQGNSVIAQWQAVENAGSYQVFIFNDSPGEYVLAGETAGTVFRTPLPAKINNPVITFFVLAKNHNGQGLPSEPAALTVEGWNKPDEGDSDADYYEIYYGKFYDFPLQRFKAVEKQAMEHLKNQRNQAVNHFTNQRNGFINRLQNIKDNFKGGIR
jgi:hypothetical protein